MFATRLADWIFDREAKKQNRKRTDRKKRHAKEEKSAPLRDLSLLLFMWFCVLDSDNCMLVGSEIFIFGPVLSNDLKVYSFIWSSLSWSQSKSLYFRTLSCTWNPTFLFLFILFSILFHFILFTLTGEEDTLKNIKKKIHIGETENRRDSWDIMMWLCTNRKRKEKNAHKIQCLTESIIAVTHQLLFRFVPCVLVRSATFFFQLSMFVLLLLMLFILFATVSFYALHLLLYRGRCQRFLSHFLSMTLCRTRILFIQYSSCHFLFVLLINCWMLSVMSLFVWMI